MDLKINAAKKALEYVKSGMVLGLGSGSTAKIFVELLGEKLNRGELTDIVCLATSKATQEQAESLGIKMSDLNKQEKLDLVVDGADEVDPDLQLIKGLGRALLREKLVEINAKEFIVIVDESKMVEKLGTKGPLPVEILPFAHEAHLRFMNSIEGCRAEHWLEENGEPAMTDNGNYLAKLWFDEGIEDPYLLADVLSIRPGIIEHGLFLDLATRIVVAAEKGTRVIEK